MISDSRDEDEIALAYWRLAEELSVREIALLILGHDPEKFEGAGRQSAGQRGYKALVNSLCAAVRRESVLSKPSYLRLNFSSYGDNSDGTEDDPPILDIDDTKIDIESLIIWLKSRGHTTGFFFGGKGSVEPYLDPDHGRYPPKLAAAVKAWIAAADNPTSQSPKQQIIKWLRENAVDFGLTGDDGKPIESAIEDIATVANWLPKGGAPKTKVEPVPICLKPMRQPPKLPPGRRSVAADLEDDIPF